MLAHCSAKCGKIVNFWDDTWNCGVLKWKYPELHNFAHNKQITVHSFQQDIENLFWLPLNMTASNQLVDLQQEIQHFNLCLDQKDT